MSNRNSAPQGTPGGARAFGERKDVEVDRRPYGGSSRVMDGADREGDMRPDPRLTVRSRIGEADARADHPAAPRALPEAIARWEGEGGSSC